MKRWAWVIVVGWGIALFLMSSYVVTVPQLAAAVGPIIGLSPPEFEVLWSRIWWIVVKGWHMTEFGLLFGLVYWIAKLKCEPRMATRIAVLIAAFAAVADELHQTMVPNRGGRLSDVAIDGLGIALTWFWIRERSWGKRGLASLATLGMLWLLANHPFGYLG